LCPKSNFRSRRSRRAGGRWARGWTYPAGLADTFCWRCTYSKISKFLEVEIKYLSHKRSFEKNLMVWGYKSERKSAMNFVSALFVYAMESKRN
jgi:hypothetical protein